MQISKTAVFQIHANSLLNIRIIFLQIGNGRESNLRLKIKPKQSQHAAGIHDGVITVIRKYKYSVNIPPYYYYDHYDRIIIVILNLTHTFYCSLYTRL